jgi:glucosamine kinase
LYTSWSKPEAKNAYASGRFADAQLIAGAPPWFIGVDAGATRCRAKLRDMSGALRAEAEGPAANAYVDFARAAEVVRDTIARVLGAEIDTHLVRVGLGVAGIGSDEEAARFASTLTGFASVAVVNDAVNACIGAHGNRDGGLVIIGTGSAGVARIAGKNTFVGGRGFHLGDDGSASRLGLEGARAAMRAADGLGPESELTNRIRARFQHDPLTMLHWAAKATPGDYGALAPLVLEAAHAGDLVAKPLVVAAATAAAALVCRVEALGAPRVTTIGGLSEALRPFLDAEVAERLTPALFDPTDGAILLAGGAVT